MIKRAIFSEIPKIIEIELGSGYKFRGEKINEKVKLFWINEFEKDLNKGIKYFIIKKNKRYIGYVTIFIKNNIGRIDYLAVLKKE